MRQPRDIRPGRGALAVSLRGIWHAHRSLQLHASQTPLYRADLLSRALGSDVWLKVETTTAAACFAWRGALTALLRARESNPVRGAVTVSTGSHGRGLAYAAARLGVEAHVFLSASCDAHVEASIITLGAFTHRAGDDIHQARSRARRFAAEGKLLFFDDGYDADLIEGAGTVGLELSRQLDNIHTVFVPMSSGALAKGTAVAVKGVQPQTRVIAARAAVTSIDRGVATTPQGSQPAQPVAEQGRGRPARLAPATLSQQVDDIVAITDTELRSAAASMIDLTGLLVQPLGAAGLAAARFQRRLIRNQRIVVVITGSDMSRSSVAETVAAGALVSG